MAIPAAMRSESGWSKSGYSKVANLRSSALAEYAREGELVSIPTVPHLL